MCPSIRLSDASTSWDSNWRPGSCSCNHRHSASSAPTQGYRHLTLSDPRSRDARPLICATTLAVRALRFNKPGRYSLGRVKISYETNGQEGWQYEHLNTTVTVQAARRETKPHFEGVLRALIRTDDSEWGV